MKGGWRHAGARALVVLHERHLRAFLETWRRADARGTELPATPDPNYASREALLAHVLGCAARYLTWIRERMEAPVPDVEERPDPAGFASRADAYLEDVLAAWDVHLRDLTVEQAESPAYPSRWGTPYCIDAMLEHAVVHPMRHGLQLEELMATGG